MKGDGEHAKSQTPSSSEPRQRPGDESNREEDVPSSWEQGESWSNAARDETEDVPNCEVGFRYLPLDIVEINVLPRVAVETLLTCRLTCRHWSSTISSNLFAGWQLTQSSARPSLLITFPNNNHTHRHIFTVPFSETRNSVSTARLNLTIPALPLDFVSQSLNGLICVGRMVCNPSTRQIVTLPQTQTYFHPPQMSIFMRNYFGYDPVTNEHKILMIGKHIDFNNNSVRMLNHVITLQRNSNSWRRIEDGPVLYNPATDGVCINGVLYYGAVLNRHMPPYEILVAFDLNLERFERYRFPFSIPFSSRTILTNLGGRPGLLSYASYHQIEELVLEYDAELKWSIRTILLPPHWEDFIGPFSHFGYIIAGMIHTGELVLVPRRSSNRLFLILYHPGNNLMRRFWINGLDGFPLIITMQNQVTVTDHVESIMFLQGFGRHSR